MNVRIEYDAAPIRHIAVQCPQCNRWFNGREIVDGDVIKYKQDLDFTDFICPVCGRIFSEYGDNIAVEETDYDGVYKDCMKRKVVWE